jgi:hypothetical protein
VRTTAGLGVFLALVTVWLAAISWRFRRGSP